MTQGFPTRVGVLGSGDVGKVLAAGFADRDAEVVLGTRRPDDAELASWAADGNVSVGSFADAASFGETIVLAVKGAEEVVTAVLDDAGRDAFAGKVVLDATNPIEGGMPPQMEVGHTDSGGERLQRWLPDAKIVKAYNSVGNPLMVDPQIEGGAPTMFLAGNDDGAKALAAAVCEAFGWAPLDVGTIERSRELESLCVLWVAIGAQRGDFGHAFKVVTA